MNLRLQFEDEGFDNRVIENTKGRVHIRANVWSDEDAVKWKETFEKKNKLCFNVWKVKDNTRNFRRIYVCLHGDKRHKGVRRTFSG